MQHNQNFIASLSGATSVAFQPLFGVFNFGSMKRKREYHGMVGTKIYRAWTNMKARCYNKNRCDYKYYGARGITVCEKWFSSFVAYYEFVSKLSNYGVEGYTLDRIENDKGYYPENVKYSTKSEQSSNKRKHTGSTSQYKGVYWRKDSKKWAATIYVNRKSNYLGIFTSELEASNAYQEALKVHVSPKLIK